jgi:hypothetical protein
MVTLKTKMPEDLAERVERSPSRPAGRCQEQEAEQRAEGV